MYAIRVRRVHVGKGYSQRFGTKSGLTRPQYPVYVLYHHARGFGMWALTWRSYCSHRWLAGGISCKILFMMRQRKRLSSHSMSKDQPVILHSFFYTVTDTFQTFILHSFFPYVYWHNVSVHVWKKAVQDKGLCQYTYGKKLCRIKGWSLTCCEMRAPFLCFIL